MPAHISKVVYTRVAYYFIILAMLTLLTACAQTSSPAAPPVVTLVPVTIEVTRLVPVEQTVVVEREKAVQVTREVTRVVSATNTPWSTPEPAELLEASGDLTGTYGKLEVEQPGCVVKVVHQIYNRPFDVLKVELFCIRGAPSYNMGGFDAVLRLGTNTAVFSRYDDITGETCYVTLRFSKDQVELDQIGTCGFGHGVYAGGTLPRVDKAVPEFTCPLSDGGPCEFK